MRTVKTHRYVLVAAFLAFAPRARGQAAPAVSFDRVLTPAQFKAAGLAKLTRAELDSLNAFVWRFTLAVTQLAAQVSQAPLEPAGPLGGSPAVIESRIDGQFNGWEGETIFKLVNGQIWQQASYAYRYHYAYSPKVLIFRSGAQYKMKVEGMEGEISVRRLK